MRPDGVAVSDSGRPVAFYRTRPAPAPAETWRLHYLHPLHAPDGTVLTEDRPEDHLHQRGVFWAWRRILKDGFPIADTWVMKDVVYEPHDVRALRHSDGSIEITATVLWRGGAPSRPLFSEGASFRFHPLKGRERRVTLGSSLTPLEDGLALAGTDDDKGYSGFSIRFVRPDALTFSTDGRPLTAAVGAVGTGETVLFRWPDDRAFPRWEVEAGCAVEGRPVRAWVLRKELSMQNCAWPGRAPVPLPKGKPVRLMATIEIRPRA